ncbi:uncharacterized protein C8Q71DRAFT_288894 [Rhodofomes roseus]|uniref:C2H2-type domain-containing protein n=1 Tax=Rhodofomes roseus TaxID=34475 RepID=A0ABQ8K3N5_9APHY|nr:uncharacterized protein C8Q71DRAFT_288894 [Rhodofomes roseus]KAH9831512.1 hypothetical protein C8Q71DRAFT_288894 [Rhodofomes roseus]
MHPPAALSPPPLHPSHSPHMALSWNDIFDFSSLDEPSTPPPAFDPTQRDICSDFSCCGLSLPDLHALVDHFEEHHVVMNGRPTCSPLVLSYPQPDPPAEPSSLFGASSPFASATHPHLYPHPDGFEHDFSDGTSDSASYSSGSTLPSPNPSEPMCLPPSLLTVHPPLPPDVLPPRQPAIERHKDQRPAHRKPASASTKQKASKAKAQLLGADHHPHIQPHAPPAETHKKRRAREREKAYKCPRPGCSKAYLNPNGLKYHLEKGTCTIVLPPEPAQAPSTGDTPQS